MVSIGQFVLCTYDGHKWVGMASEVDTAHKDIEIKFMHPPCPSRSYTWLRCDDICWVSIANILCLLPTLGEDVMISVGCVPKANILCLLKTPSFTTATGRQYYLHNGNQKYIQDIAL